MRQLGPALRHHPLPTGGSRSLLPAQVSCVLSLYPGTWATDSALPAPSCHADLSSKVCPEPAPALFLGNSDPVWA